MLTNDLRELFNALPVVPPSAVNNPGAALALYNLLKALDPPVAARWHWRDTRKVLRNLVIMKESGRKVSEIFQEQSAVTLSPRWVPWTIALVPPHGNLDMTLSACGCMLSQQHTGIG